MATQAETLEWHKKRWGQRSSNLLLPPFPCPAFSSLAMMEDSFSEWVFNSESFKEDYVLLLFLPMDGITWTRLSWRHSAWSLTSLQVLAARWEI